MIMYNSYSTKMKPATIKIVLIFLVVFSVVGLIGCSRKSMYLKPISLDKNVAVLLKNTGSYLFKYKVDDTVKMITIKGVKYREGEESQVIEHKVYVAEKSREGDFVLQFIDKTRYFGASFSYEDYSHFGDRVFEEELFEWDEKAYRLQQTKIEAGKDIPLIILAKRDQNDYSASYYFNEPGMWKDVNIFVLSIVFDTEWQE